MASRLRGQARSYNGSRQRSRCWADAKTCRSDRGGVPPCSRMRSSITCIFAWQNAIAGKRAPTMDLGSGHGLGRTQKPVGVSLLAKAVVHYMHLCVAKRDREQAHSYNGSRQRSWSWADAKTCRSDRGGVPPCSRRRSSITCIGAWQNAIAGKRAPTMDLDSVHDLGRTQNL
ncbi:hypothetical protein SAMN05216197_10850 [Pseudomonas graminis]|uniref:Uncharacterized protein n=1 Tax=Pseudomonas graminis TaxID=158627 RepID=A0A1I0CJG6_9PSED|nr:hypothetical protein SAMN05216197_10850 [Pseudomonas graminis]